MIREVTKRIVLPLTLLGTTGDPWGNDKLAFDALGREEVVRSQVFVMASRRGYRCSRPGS
jgi:hypothetical protein